MSAGPIRALVDARGVLVAADAPLEALQRQAGAAIGDTLAIPPLAALVRVTRRLRTPVARAMVVADGDVDLDLFVRAAPHADGIALTIASWRPMTLREPAADAAPIRRRDHARAAADWTWECDASLRLTVLSPQAEWLLGRPAATLLGEPLTGLFRLVPDASARIPLLDALAEQARFDDQRAEWRDEATGPYRLAGQPMLDADGHFTGFRGSAVRLAGEADATPMPAIGGDRLGPALRRPLDRIIAQAETIAAAEQGPLRPDYAGYAVDIAAAARHLLSLVDDLADLEAVERADFRPAREPLDLADLARRAAGLLSVRAAARSVTIRRPPEALVAPALGEYRRVLQIIVNLLGNAVRHTAPGSKVRVRVDAGEGVATLTVGDRGPGIAPADQPRAFEKFVRLDPAAGEGSGLGLYISRRLARAMGGDLVVVTRPGGGALFTLTLPAAPTPSA